MGVYVHFPWCLQKCPYCDFATEAIALRDVPHRRYADALMAEIALRKDMFGSARARTVYFGGGTPSLWEPESLGRVLRAIADAFGEPDEVTVECNPTSLDRGRAEALRAVGVDRISIGVQSLRDTHLRYLGRLHDADGAIRAVRQTAAVSGLRLSVDLMFGMPGQCVEELLEDARVLLEAGVQHISAYALTIESNTRFGELARKGRLPRLPDDEVAALFEALDKALNEEGWVHYEVSNYALPGEECLHNRAYWRGESYLGLGAGAVGCWYLGVGQAFRYRNVPSIESYLSAVEAGNLPPMEEEILDAETLVREGLMLGLRTAEGVALAPLAARTGIDPRAGRVRAIERQVALGNLCDHGDRLTIPRERWLLADEIVASLF